MAKKKLTRKQQLQADAKAAGIDYPAKATIADLETLLAADVAPEPKTPSASPQALDECPVCGRPGGSNHVHTILGKETD